MRNTVKNHSPTSGQSPRFRPSRRGAWLTAPEAVGSHIRELGRGACRPRSGPCLVRKLYGTIWQETVPPVPCIAANPQELSDFDVPAYVTGRLWCPHGAISGVDQSRHSNHLRAVGLLTLDTEVTSLEDRYGSIWLNVLIHMRVGHTSAGRLIMLQEQRTVLNTGYI